VPAAMAHTAVRSYRPAGVRIVGHNGGTPATRRSSTSTPAPGAPWSSWPTRTGPRPRWSGARRNCW